jgi:uncharacterized damage-inducible protein DinB
MKAHFQRMLQHAGWANHRVLELLQTTRLSPRRSLQLFAHVALHGAYHRGQIAWLVRDSSHEPVNTDFIMFAREGY